MGETATHWWRASRGFAPWFVLETLVPGAALFALLLLLSLRFVRGGFGEVRQHAWAPTASKGSRPAALQRRWWSCTCVSIAACACLPAIARGLRRCCMKLLTLPGQLELAR